MPDPDPTSSNIRCEQSFSSNSTTSPVSLLFPPQDLLTTVRMVRQNNPAVGRAASAVR